MNLKRASETIDLERHNFGKVTGGSFVKQNVSSMGGLLQA